MEKKVSLLLDKKPAACFTLPGSCHSRSFSIFLVLWISRFYRILFVGGHLTYMRTTAHPPP